MNLQARQLRKQDVASSSNLPVVKELRRLSRRHLAPADVAHLIPARVVNELNKNPTSASVRRVARFLELYTLAKDLNDSFRLYFDSEEDMMQFLFHSPGVAVFSSKQPHFCTGYTFKFPEIQALNARLNRVLTELNSLLRRYRWYPVVRHMGFGVSTFDVTEDWPARSERRHDPWEVFAIWWLCNSHNVRWIELFRRCHECKTWFFASAQHQTYCSDACRKRHASKSPEFKQRRALYMQKYRGQEKERDERAKNLA